MKKIEKFKYVLKNVWSYPIKKLRWLHEKFQQVNEEEIEEAISNPKSVYDVFSGWLLDIVQYGACFTFIVCSLFVLEGWLKWLSLPFSTGMIRWLWLDFVRQTMESFRRK